MEGASAVQDLLGRNPNLDLRVIVVWEPVLLTDYAGPSLRAVSTPRDRRVIQFWDPKRALSQDLRKGAVPGRGILWDEVLLYPPGPAWGDRAPAPAWHGGNVVDVIPTLEERIRRESGGDR